MINNNPDRTQVLRTAAQRAALAPSIHNTQPWRFRLRHGTLEMRTDPERQLQVLDPAGRQIAISCGCALFNARVAVAASRYAFTVERWPDPAEPDLFARITLGEPAAPWTPLVRLDPAIDRRQSNRREFFEDRVPEEIMWELCTAADAEDVVLVPILTSDQRHVVAKLVREADNIENADPQYRAELEQWTTAMGNRSDGVSARSFPLATAHRGDVPLRDFGTSVSGQMPPVMDSGAEQCLMVLGTHADDRMAWLRAGEALERVWLEATRLDYVASLISQPVEVRQTRQQLRRELDVTIWPQTVLRVGQAAPNTATSRRDLADVLEEPVAEPARR